LKAALFKKGLQGMGCFYAHNPSADLGLVVQLVDFKKVAHRTGHTRLWVGGGKNHFGYPSVQDGTCTHGARLKRHVEFEPRESVVSKDLTSLTEGLHFGMGAGVVFADTGIAPRGNDGGILGRRCGAYEHGSYGDFPFLCSQLGLRKGDSHTFFVGHGLEGFMGIIGIIGVFFVQRRCMTVVVGKGVGAAR
jgi:hypothetical protein